MNISDIFNCIALVVKGKNKHGKMFSVYYNSLSVFKWDDRDVHIGYHFSSGVTFVFMPFNTHTSTDKSDVLVIKKKVLDSFN